MASNWKGEWNAAQSNDPPSDEDFAHYFEGLLNPPGEMTDLHYNPDTPKYMPVLDNPIEPTEVAQAVQQLNPNKAPGIDGLPPGVLKWLPLEWILMLCVLFNSVSNGQYIPEWLRARFVIIFKKEDHTLPVTYRGTGIVSSLAKLYDIILANRFRLWYQPKPEQ